MEGGLLSLKWNNHKSTFFHVLSNVRKKDQYSDATIACDGKFYKVHKLVLSTCSEYFEEMFALTDGKSPIIVLKDIKGDELESLLSYMYIGEVNVVQDKLAGLIKAAECLRIKGLAVPDEDPMPSRPSHREKRSIDNSVSSDAKRRKEDSRPSSNSYQNRNSSCEETVKPSEPIKSRNSVHSPTRQITISDNIEPINNHNEESSSVKEELNEIATPCSEIEHVEEPQNIVKQEPSDDIDAVFIEDSNSVPENKDMMNDMNISDSQQHFMDELLGQNSEHGNMSAASEFDESESSAGPSQQQMMEYVATGRGNTKLLLKGYVYTTEKKKADRIYWKCERRYLCHGRVTTDYWNHVISVGTHTHPPDYERTRSLKNQDQISSSVKSYMYSAHLNVDYC